MTTRRGRWHGKYGAEAADLAKKMGLPLTDVKCERCRNQIISGGGVFFRPKDGSGWKIFCRFDCAQLHLGKDAKILDREAYAAQIVNDAIKKR